MRRANDYHRLATLPVLLLAATGADAQFRCDCTSIMATCSADVEVRGSSIAISADVQQCARVDYFVDGMPFVSVLVDGDEQRDWIPGQTEPKILVQSCQVCRENEAFPQLATTPRSAPTAAAAAAADADAGDGKIEPLIAGVPAYPAAANGVRGHVDVELTIDAAGSVTAARVAAAEPAGIFDQAALAAAQRWRYPAALDRAPVVQRERLEFAPPAAAPAAARVERVPQPGAPRNQCVRQSAVYNYGDSVDVGLMNICSEALALYSCAVGTGRSRGLWMCADSESRASLLVPQGDARLGTSAMLAVPGALRTVAHADEFAVTRPPNTEHWWVACPPDDEACRAAARTWSRGLQGQPATIDPQARSAITVARSY